MTEESPPTGLEDVTVAATRLSHVDGGAGELTIAGFPVEELAENAGFEETVFLLLEDRLPTAGELSDFRRDLAQRRTIADPVEGVVRAAAEAERPAMDALRMGLAAADLGATGADPRATAERVVAVVPTIVAAYWRFRGGTHPVEPDPTPGHAENYLHLLSGEEPEEAAVRGLETYLSTVVDHGLNASTLAARVVVSTESDLVSAATAAVGALKGPLHGGAPGPVLEGLRAAHDAGDPEAGIRETLEAGERLMGFGHRVYRVRDSRAAVLESAAERVYTAGGEAAFFGTVRAFEDAALEALAEHKPDRALRTNVEFYTAALLHGVDIPRALFTPTFAVARAAGWMAHGVEQLADNRLIRPRSRYVGERGRSWTPIEAR